MKYIDEEGYECHDIYAENGKKFCVVKKKGDEIILVTKQGELRINRLVAQIYCYDLALRMKNSRVNNSYKSFRTEKDKIDNQN